MCDVTLYINIVLTVTYVTMTPDTIFVNSELHQSRK